MKTQFVFHPQYRTPELWDEIASYCTRRTLHNLALVHSYTVGPAQRHLFMDLAFIVSFGDFEEIEEQLTLEESNAQLSRSLERFRMLSSSHLSKYVRRWFCQGLSNSLDDESYPALLATANAILRLIESLPQYPLLDCLILSQLVVDHSTLLAISSIKNLRSLHLQYVVFACPPVFVDPLSLRHLLLDVSNGDYKREELTGRIFSPPHLETLTCMYYAKSRVSTLLSSLLADLLTHKPHTNLVQLTFQITRPSPDGIKLFLDLLGR
ncbi:hypothetical protein CPC08DRAFT_171556 [Agrocybe pediades]|nr:hypothetical protein CPC08DRAFT_171556 [Agrocybe pediades]